LHLYLDPALYNDYVLHLPLKTSGGIDFSGLAKKVHLLSILLPIASFLTPPSQAKPPPFLGEDSWNELLGLRTILEHLFSAQQ